MSYRIDNIINKRIRERITNLSLFFTSLLFSFFSYLLLPSLLLRCARRLHKEAAQGGCTKRLPKTAAQVGCTRRLHKEVAQGARRNSPLNSFPRKREKLRFTGGSSSFPKSALRPSFLEALNAPLLNNCRKATLREAPLSGAPFPANHITKPNIISQIKPTTLTFSV